MNVEQLIKELQKFPPHYDVFMSQENTDYELSLANEIKVEEALFSDESGDPDFQCRDNVVVIRDV